jgi:hypothetical protein
VFMVGRGECGDGGCSGRAGGMRLLTLTFVRASKMGSLRTMMAVVFVYRRE